MPRPIRIEYEDAVYHVMNRGRGRKTIFHSDGYYQVFLRTLDEAVQRFGVVVHGYCLMSNHYHLLIETPRGNLSRIMRHINGVYTQRYNRLKNTDGPLFRGRYKAIVVDKDAYLLQLSRYIHRNPIDTKKPMVKKLEAYRWSSYCAYIGKGKTPDWLTRDKVYSMLGKQAKGYQRYVEMGVDEELQHFYGKGNLAAILGDKAFRERVLVGNTTTLSEPQQRKVVGPPPGLNKVIENVAVVFNVKKSTITGGQVGRQPKNTARKVAMYIGQQRCDFHLAYIRDYFGINHVGSVSNSISDIKRRLVEDAVLKRKVEKVLCMIQ